ARVGEREDDATVEVIVAAAVRETGGAQLVEREPFLGRAARERRAAGREAEPELLAHGFAEAARREVLARVRALLALPQHALVEAGRALEQLRQPLLAPACGVGFG